MRQDLNRLYATEVLLHPENPVFCNLYILSLAKAWEDGILSPGSAFIMAKRNSRNAQKYFKNLHTASSSDPQPSGLPSRFLFLSLPSKVFHMLLFRISSHANS